MTLLVRREMLLVLAVSSSLKSHGPACVPVTLRLRTWPDGTDDALPCCFLVHPV